MHASLTLLLLLSQVPCAPSDSTLVCHCKQGSASACAALAEIQPELAQSLIRAASMAKTAEEAAKAQEQAASSVDTGCGGQSPHDDEKKCTGQEHHIISKAVWRALADHLVLKGQYRYRDPRFVSRAKDLKAHCGWQDWHRDVDDEIAEWLGRNPNATKQQFEAYLRQIYSRPHLRARFPNGF